MSTTTAASAAQDAQAQAIAAYNALPLWQRVPGATAQTSPTDLLYLQLKNQVDGAGTRNQLFQGYAWESTNKGMGSFDAVLKDMASRLSSKGITELSQIQLGSQPNYVTVPAVPVYTTSGYGEGATYTLSGYQAGGQFFPSSAGLTISGEGEYSATIQQGTKPALINGNTGAVIATSNDGKNFNFGITYAGHGATSYNFAWNAENGVPILNTTWQDTSSFDADFVQMLGLFLAFTPAAPALGGLLTGGAATGAMATFIGNAVINTALNGGDVGKAILSAGASFAGSKVAGWAGGAAGKLFGSELAGQVIGNIAGATTKAVLLGQDVDEAVRSAAIGGAVGIALANIPGFDQIQDENLKKAIVNATTAAASGKSADEIILNAAAAAGVTYGLSQIDGFNNLDTKYQDIIRNSLTQGIKTGDFAGAALNGAISAAAAYGAEAYNRDRVTQYLKDNGQLPTGNYDQLTFDEQAVVDNIVSEQTGFMFSDAQVKAASNDYLYTDAADVSSKFNEHFSDVPEGMTKAQYYAKLEDLGVIDGVDSNGNIIPPLEYIGVSNDYVDDAFSQVDMDLDLALQQDPNLDLGVIQQVYGYNNAQDALAGYLDRVENGVVISNADDYNAARETLNSVLKYSNGEDPLALFNGLKDTVGLDAAAIESMIPGISYEDFVHRLDSSYLTSQEVIDMYQEKLGRDPTPGELGMAQAGSAWNLERSLQVQSDINQIAFNADENGSYKSLDSAIIAANAEGYGSVVFDGKLYDIKKPTPTSVPLDANGMPSAASDAAWMLAANNYNEYQKSILDGTKYTGNSTSDHLNAANKAWQSGKLYYTYNNKTYKVPDNMDTVLLEAAINDADNEYVLNELANYKVPTNAPLLDLAGAQRQSELRNNIDTAVAQYKAAAASGDATATKLYLSKLSSAQKAYDDFNAAFKVSEQTTPAMENLLNSDEDVQMAVKGSENFRLWAYNKDGTPSFTGGEVGDAIMSSTKGAVASLAKSFNTLAVLAGRGMTGDMANTSMFALTDDQLKSFANSIDLPVDSTELYKWADQYQKIAASEMPLWAQEARAEYLNRINSAQGADKLWAAFAGAVNNPAGFLTLAGSDILEEGAMFAMSFGISSILRAGAKTTLALETAMNMAESFTGGYESTKSALLAQGKSASEADSAGMLSGLFDAGITAAITPMVDYALIKKIMRGTADDIAGSFAINIPMQYVTEGTEGALQSIEQQLVQTGTVNKEVVYQQAAIEGLVGVAAASGILSTDAALYYGNRLLSDYKAQNPDTPLDPRQISFEMPDGSFKSFGEIGAQLYASDENGGQWVNMMPTEMSDDIRDNVDFSLDEQTGMLTDLGVTGHDPAEWSDVLSDVKTQVEGEQKLLEWADPLYMDREEAQTYLQGLGYEGTAEEVDALLRDNGNSVAESEAQSRIDQYVADHTVTADELRDQLLAENPTLTEEEIQAYAQSGAGVNQDQVIADTVSAVDAAYRTEQEVRDQFNELGLTRITDDDAARFAGAVAESDTFAADAEAYLPTASQNLFIDYLNNGTLPGAMTSEEVQQIVNSAISAMPPGLSIEEVTTAINNELAKLPESATPDDVNAAIATAQTALSDRISGVEAGLQEQYDALSEDQQALADQLVAQGETLQSAIDTATTTLGEQIAGVEEGLQEQYDALSESQQQLADDLVAQGETLEEAIATAQASLEEQITGVSEEVQAKYDALSEGQQALADQLVQQGVDLQTAIDTATTTLEEQITGVSEDLQTKYESLTQGQQDLADALVAQGETLESAIATAQSALEGQITGVQEDVQAKYDSLTEGQQALADQLVAQGETLESAIATAQTSLETQIGDVETALNEKLDTYEQAGIDRDAALSSAIDDVATDLGTTREAILTHLGTTEENIRADMQSAYDTLAQQNQELADMLGKPAQEVTQADIDFINSVIAGNADTNLAYDANQDGVIDQSDIGILNSILAGTNADWQAPEGSMWAPTGMYGQMAGMQTDFSRQLAEMEAKRLADAARASQIQYARDLGRSASEKAAAAQQALQQPRPTVETLFGGMDYYTVGTDPFASTAKPGVLTGSQLAAKRNKMAAGGYVESDFQALLRMLQE